MNTFDLITLGLAILFGIILVRDSVFFSLMSFVSALLAFIITNATFNSVLAKIDQYGYKENVYFPSLLFILMIIILWALILSLISYLPKVKAPVYVKVPVCLLMSVLFAIYFMSIACLTLAPFIENNATFDNFQKSATCTKTLAFDGLKNLKLSRSRNDYFKNFKLETDNSAVILPDDLKLTKESVASRGDLLNLINQDRHTNGLEPLADDTGLDRLASTYGLKIYTDKYFSHVDRDGLTPSGRADAQGIKYNYFGENLAVADTVAQAHINLMNSPRHRDNILSPVFKNVGLSVYELKPHSVLIVEEFSN